MEKFIYWIKRTLHHSKHCNSLCMLCKYYDECKIDGPVIAGGHDNERNVFYNSRMQPLLRK